MGRKLGTLEKVDTGKGIGIRHYMSEIQPLKLCNSWVFRVFIKKCFKWKQNYFLHKIRKNKWSVVPPEESRAAALSRKIEGPKVCLCWVKPVYASCPLIIYPQQRGIHTWLLGFPEWVSTRLVLSPCTVFVWKYFWCHSWKKGLGRDKRYWLLSCTEQDRFFPFPLPTIVLCLIGGMKTTVEKSWVWN